MPPFLTLAKYAGFGLLILLVLGGAFMLRDELIEKGMNIVKAQDNAALVKAQQEQATRDAVLIASQNAYINDLQNSSANVKERIRVVQAPCKDDGAGDPRVRDTVDWLRGKLTPRGVAPDSGPQPKDPVRPPGSPIPLIR